MGHGEGHGEGQGEGAEGPEEEPGHVLLGRVLPQVLLEEVLGDREHDEEAKHAHHQQNAGDCFEY